MQIGLDAFASVGELGLSSINGIKEKAATFTKIPSTSESDIPLLPINANESDDSIPSLESSGSTLSKHLFQRSKSQSSLREKLKFASLGALDSISRSSGSTPVAEDLIKGEGSTGPALSVCQVVPEKDLSLFELGILANVIHEEDPKYCLLSRQCYWFVGTMLLVVESMWGNKLCKEEAGCPSPREYLPNQQGKWRNLSVNAEPTEADIERVKSRFMERREEEFSLVGYNNFFNYLILTSIRKVSKAEAERIKREREFAEMEKRLRELEAKFAGSD